MSEAAKKVEKVKSFDKRLSLLFNCQPFPEGDELIKCLELIVEKAKYGEHFAQIAYLCETKNIGDLDTLQKCAMKAVEHPAQAGKVIRALYFAGHQKSALDLWEKTLEQNKEISSYYAQTLSIGHWLPEAKLRTDTLIKKFLTSGGDSNEYESLTKPTPAPSYNFI